MNNAHTSYQGTQTVSSKASTGHTTLVLDLSDFRAEDVLAIVRTAERTVDEQVKGAAWLATWDVR